jgi:large subunit ribosomal protein L11
MEFCNSMLELKIKPAKYAQYKLLYKDKSFEFVVKPACSCSVNGSCKAKIGSGELIVKKVASVTWEQIRAIAEDKMPDLNAFTTELR